MTDTITPEVGKTYLTRDGQKARCICTDRRNDEYPVVCLVSAKVSEAIETYTANGRFHSDQFEYPFDLVSEAPRVVTVESVRAEYLAKLIKRADDQCAKITDSFPRIVREALNASCWLRSQKDTTHDQ